MGSLGVTRERTQARFQGALSGNHEWAHCDAPCGLLNIAWLIQILKSPQRSYQPEMYGSVDAKCVFTRSCISCFRHLASLSFRPFCREVALCFSQGNQCLPSACYSSDRPCTACDTHTSLLKSHTQSYSWGLFSFQMCSKGSLDFTSCSFYCLNDFLIKKNTAKIISSLKTRE